MNGYDSQWWCTRCGKHSEQGARIVELTVTYRPIWSTGRPSAIPSEKTFRLCDSVDCHADALERAARELRQMKIAS